MERKEIRIENTSRDFKDLELIFIGDMEIGQIVKRRHNYILYPSLPNCYAMRLFDTKEDVISFMGEKIDELLKELLK